MAVEDPFSKPSRNAYNERPLQNPYIHHHTPRRNLLVKGPRDLDEYRGRMLGNIIPEDSLSYLGSNIPQSPNRLSRPPKYRTHVVALIEPLKEP